MVRPTDGDVLDQGRVDAASRDDGLEDGREEILGAHVLKTALLGSVSG